MSLPEKAKSSCSLGSYRILKLDCQDKTCSKLMAVYYASTMVILVTALGFFSRMCSLESLKMLESEHHEVTALSEESWRVGLEAEMGFPVSEAYSLPMNAKFLVASVMANLCGSHYPLHMAMVEAFSQRELIDTAFSVPKCVRLARMSHQSHRLLQKMLGVVPGDRREDLSEIWGEQPLSLETENTSDFDRKSANGKATSNTQALDEIGVTQAKMMVFEPLLEASGERNLRSINLTHGEYPCHCLAQKVWYPEQSNLCLIWDTEEILSIGLLTTNRNSISSW